MEIKMWERACSRMRCVSLLIYRLKDRIREQARSHIDGVVSVQTCYSRCSGLTGSPDFTSS
ncbi:hypothetical protein DJ480_25120 [Pseudomonas sp. Leaf98]|nr:hypothetical protein DJ480_25120 [Pseudomonas sp. Leaf98]